MLSESEQRRLNEIESLLQGEDPSWASRFARTADTIAVHRRRLSAVVIAILATVTTVIGLVLANVPLVVVSICLVGAAAFMWTYRRHGQKIDRDQPVDQDADPSAA
jgi:Flp pilus assembly protein TadB